mmetsp:Transcript_13832/g.56051  ORF Transcript_13832/g.56051 Transcript_13832/m.56051 type:complete len:354 (-) Transcript_13832:283-1344(-)
MVLRRPRRHRRLLRAALLRTQRQQQSVGQAQEASEVRPPARVRVQGSLEVRVRGVHELPRTPRQARKRRLLQAQRVQGGVGVRAGGWSVRRGSVLRVLQPLARHRPPRSGYGAGWLAGSRLRPRPRSLVRRDEVHAHAPQRAQRGVVVAEALHAPHVHQRGAPGQRRDDGALLLPEAPQRVRPPRQRDEEVPAHLRVPSPVHHVLALAIPQRRVRVEAQGQEGTRAPRDQLPLARDVHALAGRHRQRLPLRFHRREFGVGDAPERGDHGVRRGCGVRGGSVPIHARRGHGVRPARNLDLGWHGHAAGAPPVPHHAQVQLPQAEASPAGVGEGERHQLQDLPVHEDHRGQLRAP